MFSDGQFLDGLRDYRGTSCGSGCNFVTITPDGGVYRCGSGQCLGNLLLKNVRLLDGPKPCDASYCPYFCVKYTSTQFVPKASDAQSQAGQISGQGVCLKSAGGFRGKASFLLRRVREFISR